MSDTSPSEVDPKAWLGAQLFIRDVAKLVGVEIMQGSLSDLLDVLRALKDRLDQRDREANLVRAALGMGTSTTEELLVRLTSRTEAGVDVPKYLAQLSGLPQETPPEDVLRHVQAAVEAYRTPQLWKAYAAALPLSEKALRLRLGLDKTMAQPFSEEILQRFGRDLDKAMTQSAGLVEYYPDPLGPVAAYNVLVNDGGLFEIFCLTTHRTVRQKLSVEEVQDFFLRKADEGSREGLRSSLEDALRGGERWSVIQATGSPETLSEQQMNEEDYRRFVVTRVELLRENPLLRPSERQGGGRSSGDQAPPQEDVSIGAVAGTKISGANDTRGSDLRISDSTGDRSRSEPLSDPSAPRITQQIFRDPVALRHGDRYGVYDATQRKFLLRRVSAEAIQNHFAGLVASDNADALSLRIRDALAGTLSAGCYSLVSMHELVAEQLRRTESAPQEVLLTVDMTAPGAWEHLVTMPDVTPGIRFRDMWVDPERRGVFLIEPGDAANAIPATFEVIAATVVGITNEKAYAVRDLTLQSGHTIFPTSSEVRGFLFRQNGAEFVVAVQEDLASELSASTRSAD